MVDTQSLPKHYRDYEKRRISKEVGASEKARNTKTREAKKTEGYASPDDECSPEALSECFSLILSEARVLSECSSAALGPQGRKGAFLPQAAGNVLRVVLEDVEQKLAEGQDLDQDQTVLESDSQCASSRMPLLAVDVDQPKKIR